MSIRVTKETSESEFQAQKDKIDECKSALNSAKGTFTAALGTARSNVSTALSGMSAWAADDVQVKLDDFCVNELQAGIDAIESDITGGSYNSLINTAGTLSGDFAACKELKKAWEDAKKTLENTPKTRKVANNANWSLSYQGGQNPNNADYGFHYEANPDYENNAKAVEKAEKALEQRVTSTNTHLSELSQFVYGGASSANNAVGGASTLGSQTGSSSAMETSQRAAQEAADRENAIIAYMEANPNATKEEAEAAVDEENKKAPYDLIQRKYTEEAVDNAKKAEAAAKRTAQEATDRDKAIAAYMAAYEGISRSEAESAVDAERGLTSYDMITRKYSEVAATAALATYVGDDAPSAVVSEESDSSIRFEQDADGDGVTGYEEKTHEKKNFEDGVKTDMNYNTTGDANITDPENPVKDPKHKTGEGTLTDKAGEVHDVKTDETWGENGKHVEDVTVSKDGELEVHKNDDTHIEGTSSPDKEVKSETKTTDIKEQDGSTTSVKSTEIKSTIGNNSATQTQTSKTNDSDPEVGVTERTDGNHTYKYETYRDKSGNLHERVYEDGVLQSDDQVEHDYRTITVKDSSGKTMLTRTYDLGTERGLEEFYSDTSNAATEATDHYGFGYDPEVVRGDAPVILGDYNDGTMDFYSTQVTVEKADGPQATTPTPTVTSNAMAGDPRFSANTSASTAATSVASSSTSNAMAGDPRYTAPATSAPATAAPATSSPATSAPATAAPATVFEAPKVNESNSGNGYIEVTNQYNDATEKLYRVNADFNDGQGQVDHYFYSEESYNNYNDTRNLVKQLSDAAQSGGETTVMMNVGGEEKPVTVYFDYGNMPDSLDYSVGTTWSSESAGGQQYTPINSWDTSVFSNAKFYDDDGESYSAEDLLINAKPMN